MASTMLASPVELLVKLHDTDEMRAAVYAGADEAVQAATLIARIISTREAQLEEKRKQQERAQSERMPRQATAPPKEKKPKDPKCPACLQGKHRAHTCT
mmetsp:Transcript_25568/g.64989  ORF Transcript_25568/g.64989 Transcript_25568/m.64989 type:complete len:99 (+) Transcript_25568:150-446(+)|eukprot:CAMPEP_0115874850 /NCGR_PEP_ID=MMETSP0287-20121206/24766_1 /TAXON_ID=412157 /ORGANISM="Chrysochromulina rotalis, Strain UIO044" /LENGTH=98 /DNA_ID=CAMNT_0003330039 /DNA_START=127 /DNA_END=426 /DNA_ORIENTATION=-